MTDFRAYSNKNDTGTHYVLEVPKASKDEIKLAMVYRGMDFSLAASNPQRAVLFSSNPYSIADLARPDDRLLGGYRRAIDASRALTGSRTYRTPPGKELWPYQAADVDYLLERGGGIDADQPGLGKTPTSIVFCNEVEASRVLVICPASVRIQWEERIKEWSTIPFVKVSCMLKVKDGIHPKANYQIISYEAARNPAIIRAIGRGRWDVMICDEAHKMKNQEAITTRAILGNSRGEFQHGEDRMPCIGSYCDKAVALTGTPLLNRPSECYVLFRYFDWEAIDYLSEDAFKEKYNKQGAMRTLQGKRFNLESTALELELQNRLRVHVMTRHEKKDVLKQMKPPRYNIVKVAENAAIKSALDAENMLDIPIDDIRTVKDIKILGHIAEVRRLMGEAMAPQVVDYARDFLEGSDEKLVIFGWHLSVISLYAEGLKQFGTVMVHGGTSPLARQKTIEDFRTKPDVRVWIANMKSGGEGVDGLQDVCSRCYLAEPDWVPSNNEQAVARLDRLGQKELVTAEVFMAPGSISEKILVKALEKMNVIHRVLDEKGKIQ